MATLAEIKQVAVECSVTEIHDDDERHRVGNVEQGKGVDAGAVISCRSARDGHAREGSGVYQRRYAQDRPKNFGILGQNSMIFSCNRRIMLALRLRQPLS